MKYRFQLMLIFMFLISGIFMPGVDQSASAQTYTRLTNGTASAVDFNGGDRTNSMFGPIGNVFDSNTSTAWGFPFDGFIPMAITFSLPSPKILIKYRILGGNIDAWMLYGTNPGSAVLHTGTSSDIGQLITLSNTTAYSNYILVIWGVAYNSIPFPIFGITELEYYASTQAPPTASFSASPTTINQGASSTLTWSTTNATSVSFSPSIGSTALNGSKTVSPSSTTTYTMTATGPGGTTTKTVTVNENISSPPTASFSANPTTINQGGSSTLTWSTTNATSVSFSPSIGSTALNGSKTVSPASTTTYTMTATGPGGTIAKTATIYVDPLPPSQKGAIYEYDQLGRIISIIRAK